MTKQEALTLCNEILQKTGVAEILTLPNINNRTHLSKRTQDETANRKALDFAISLQEYPNYDWLYNKLSDLQDYFVTADQKDGLEIYNQLHTNWLSVFFDKAVNIYSRYDNVDLFDQAFKLYSLLTDIRKYKKSHFETFSNEPQQITTKQEAGALCNEILQKTGVAEIFKIPNYDYHQKLSSRTQSKQEKQAEEIASTFAQWFSTPPNYDWLYNKLSDLQDYFATADQKDGLEIYNQLHTNWLYAIFHWALKNDFAPYPTKDRQEENNRKLLNDIIDVIQSIKDWAKSVKSQQPISEPVNKETKASADSPQEASNEPQQAQQPVGEPQQGKNKRGRPTKKFRDLLTVNDKDAAMQKLHHLLDGRKGKEFALIILACVLEGKMQKPTYPQTKNEFRDIGSATGFLKYLTEQRHAPEEVEGARRLIQNL